MPNYKAIVAEISDLEGKYKRVHNNVRAASESIAFFGVRKRNMSTVFGLNRCFLLKSSVWGTILCQYRLGTDVSKRKC